jgi:hypothetical protein
VSDVQAGTPTPTPDDRTAGTPAVTKDDSGLNAQQQKEYLTLKQKAEDYNKLEAAMREKDLQIEELARRAYGGGQAATDPYAEDIAALQQQAEFDPAARVTLRIAQKAEIAGAEAWLAKELLVVPEAKRAQVEDYIRTKGYSVGAKYAMRALTDPETQTLAQKLAETQAELEKLKGARPNGTSPGFVVPATASGSGEVLDKITPQDYAAILKQGGANALKLMEAVGSGKTKLSLE